MVSSLSNMQGMKNHLSQKIKPKLSNLTVKREALHGNQETDYLKPVFPDNDYIVKYGYHCKAGGRLFDFFEICALLHSIKGSQMFASSTGQSCITLFKSFIYANIQHIFRSSS